MRSFIYRIFRGLAPVIGAAALSVVPLTTAADPASDDWKAPPRAARKPNPISADNTSIAAGKVVYAAQCISCHGPAGHGDGSDAKDLDPKPPDLSERPIQSQTDGAIYWKISQGRKPMPRFEKLTSENDRWNVINYLRTLADNSGKP